MSENINFFNAAIKLLRVENIEKADLGTTENEFAENYANASGAAKGSSVWNDYFEEGKKEYKIINSDGKDGITQEEFNKVKFYINKISQPFKHLAEDFLSGFDGDNKYISEIRTRVTQDNSKIPEKFDENIPQDNANVQQMTEEQKAKLKELLLNKKTRKTKIQNVQEKPILETNHSERKNLKMIETMTREEIVSELLEYDKNYKVKDETDTEVLKKYLQEAREYNIKNDQNSNAVDYHIGTFAQGTHGTCTLLSKINCLSEDILRKIYQEVPAGSGNYQVTFPLDFGNENKTVTITKEELETGEISIKDDTGKEYTLNDFSHGDKDVALLEMAFMKRFGTRISLNGADIKMIEEIFTFPEDKEKRVTPEEQRTVESYQITEDKIIQALNDGNHPIVGVQLASRLPADFSYQDVVEVTDNNGNTISAHWGFANESNESDARKNLKRLLGHNSPLYSQIDSMPVGKFMDLANKFVGGKSSDCDNEYGYGFIGAIILSNGVSVIENHALSIVDYNPETKTVMLANPNYNSASVPIPLAIMEKFFEISV